MISHKIWRFLVAVFSLLMALSYALLIVKKGTTLDGNAIQGGVFLSAGVGLIYHLFKGQREEQEMSGPLTSQAIAEYECALETLGNIIAARSQAIHEERTKEHPDDQKIADLRKEQGELVIERNRLMIEDTDGIRRVISNYGAQVRAQI